jgi:hypothetical protein
MNAELTKMRIIAIVAMALAGLIHLGLGLVARGNPLAHSLFFGAGGALQFAWSVALWRRPTPALQRLGLILAGGAVVLWLLTRVLPAPFAGTPGDVSALGVTAALSESLAVIALLGLITEPRLTTSRQSVVLLILREVLTLILVGLAAYAFGVAMETFLPTVGLSVRHR